METRKEGESNTIRRKINKAWYQKRMQAVSGGNEVGRGERTEAKREKSKKESGIRYDEGVRGERSEVGRKGTREPCGERERRPHKKKKSRKEIGREKIHLKNKL